MSDIYRRALALALARPENDAGIVGEPMMAAVAHAQRVAKLEADLETYGKDTEETEDRIIDAEFKAQELITENAQLRAWVCDLQSGMYINCVYCGYRYGPGETRPMQAALKAHVEQCPEHPMSELRGAVNEALVALANTDLTIRGQLITAEDRIANAQTILARALGPGVKNEA